MNISGSQPVSHPHDKLEVPIVPIVPIVPSNSIQ
jgi:hypothetical protein